MNTNITAITFPAGVTEIGDSAFAACDKLTDITIPDSIRRKVDTHVRPGRDGMYIGPRGVEGTPSKPDPDDD